MKPRRMYHLALLACLVLPAVVSQAEDAAAGTAGNDPRRTALVIQRAELQSAAQKKPDDLEIHSRLGSAHLFLGEFKESVAAFERMIQIDPRQDAPHWQLGIAYYFAGDFEKSSRQFEKYHTYEARDRENGIWKFLADAKQHGIESARGRMLEYTRFDREPFPALYEISREGSLPNRCWPTSKPGN